MVAGISWAQVRCWRVQRQLLLGADGQVTGGSAVEVVSRLGGVQAQVPSAAALAVAVRQRDPDPSGVAAALKKKQLVRTWAMRGTLHLLPPAEAPPLLSLIAASRTWEKGSWQKTFLTTEQMERLSTSVQAALADGTPKTRTELLEHLDADLREHAGSGWSAVLKPLAWQGLLAQGPARGTSITFVRPGWTGLPDPDDAAGDVILRYLGTYGPATPAAFDQWLIRGATSGPRLRRWFADLDDRTTEVDVEGQVLVVRNQDLEAIRETEPRPVVRLLPGFDQFVLGPGTKDEQTVPTEHRPEVSRAAGWIAPVVVVDGRVAGTWSSDGGEIVTQTFAPVPARALRKEVERVTPLLNAG